MTLNNLESKQNDCRNYETESLLIGVDGSFKIHTEPPTSSAIETVFEIMRTEDNKIVYNIERLLYFNSEQEEAIFWKKCIDSLINYVDKRLNYNFKRIPIMPFAYSQNVCYVINRLLKIVIDNDNMKFSAIVGNPPYQIMDGGTDRGAIPVYHHFMNISKRVRPNYISMIMPARWYAGGRGLDEFRSDMISDTHLFRLHDYELSKDLFPTVDIAGGLCTFLWDNNYNGPCMVTNYNAIKDINIKRYLNQFDTLIRLNAAVSILEKVISISTSYLKDSVLSINPFGFRTYFRGKDNGDIKILTSKGWSKVNRTEITKGIEYIDQYKIIVGRFVPSNGEMSVKPGEGYRVLTEPQILSPAEINTETYIDTAVFSTPEEATNYKKYLLSKFARFLLRQGITSVNVTRECFAFVPQQDFTSSSDIDWYKSVSEIDKQLYMKYHLTNEEISFIESMIKPM